MRCLGLFVSWNVETSLFLFFQNRINWTNINACFIWTSLAPSPHVMGELIHPLSPWKKERLMAGNRWLSLISIGSLTPNTKPTSDVICHWPKVPSHNSAKRRCGLFSKQKRMRSWTQIYLETKFSWQWSLLSFEQLLAGLFITAQNVIFCDRT